MSTEKITPIKDCKNTLVGNRPKNSPIYVSRENIVDPEIINQHWPKDHVGQKTRRL